MLMRRLSACAILLAIKLVLPPLVPAQSEEAKNVHAELLKSAKDPRFSAIVESGLAAISSVEDTLWILESAAAAAIPDQRKSILESKASILELVGRYGEAGTAWEAAATATDGPADPRLLMSSAFCMLASGDADAAGRLAATVIFLAPDPATAKLAVIAGAWSKAIGQTDNVVPDSVKPLLEDENPRVALSALLLARTVSDGTVREGYDKIIARRFPSVVEMVRSIPHPLMLLFAAEDSSNLVEPAPAPKAVPAPVRSDPEASQAVQYFQVGAYRKGANAEAVVSRQIGRASCRERV